LLTSTVQADRIEYFEYETCYMEVPAREAPTHNARVAFVIPQYVTVRVSAQQDHWVKIIYRDENNDYWIGWAASTAMCPID